MKVSKGGGRVERPTISSSLQIAFAVPPPNGTLPGRVCGRTAGYDWQMYTTFHSDLYTDHEYIALIDNDAMFTTPVTPQALWARARDGRGYVPRIVGKHTVYLEDGRVWWPRDGPQNGRWAEATKTALGLKQVADFMWNFPVLIRRDTFVLCRQHIMKHLNTSFEAAFRVIAMEKLSYCQIGILLNYAWYFQHDLYEWHLQSTVASEGDFASGVHDMTRNVWWVVLRAVRV